MLSANHRRSLLTDKDHDGENNDNGKDDEKRRVRIRVEAKEKEVRAIIKERNKDCKWETNRRKKSFSTPVVLMTWT